MIKEDIESKKLRANKYVAIYREVIDLKKSKLTELILFTLQVYYNYKLNYFCKDEYLMAYIYILSFSLEINGSWIY